MAAEQRGIILVRHAMPAIEPGVPSHRWRLDEHAREDCVLLAHALTGPLAPVVYASDQPKAGETGVIIALRKGLQTATDARFGEIAQGGLWVENYRTLAESYVAGAAVEGWEDREAAVARFDAAVREALAGVSGDADLVVATHGLAMTLWLATRTDIDPVPFWRALTFPDAWRLEPEGWTLTRLWEAGLRPPGD